ncbi:MAG: hypothetical protein HC915_18375 [Anaerolineae bacterium]|nr:hypothetical protein [Anaerolineae bacterium]
MAGILMRRGLGLGLVVLLAALVACAPLGLEDPGPAEGGAGQPGQVTAVIDGDTIDVRLGDGAVQRVRYIGVNTPEREEACYSEAVRANRALVAGQSVTLFRDVSETDRFGRLLRYVYVGETFVNETLVTQGWAEAVRFPPDTRYWAHFSALARRAYENRLGCHPFGVFEVPPPTPDNRVCDCSGNRYNCADFATRAQAQACFEACFPQVGDVHRLDGDGDRRVCSSLP